MTRPVLPVLCDPDGKVAWCESCGQIHSPYWSAAKSKHLHQSGIGSRDPGHRVTVMHASELALGV